MSRKPKTKKDKIKIDRSEICKVDQSELPNDAEFKGYESIVVQEILITTDNVEYKREKYYSPSENKTYLGKVPIVKLHRSEDKLAREIYV